MKIFFLEKNVSKRKRTRRNQEQNLLQSWTLRRRRSCSSRTGRRSEPKQTHSILQTAGIQWKVL